MFSKFANLNFKANILSIDWSVKFSLTVLFIDWSAKLYLTVLFNNWRFRLWVDPSKKWRVSFWTHVYQKFEGSIFTPTSFNQLLKGYFTSPHFCEVIDFTKLSHPSLKIEEFFFRSKGEGSIKKIIFSWSACPNKKRKTFLTEQRDFFVSFKKKWPFWLDIRWEPQRFGSRF